MQKTMVSSRCRTRSPLFWKHHYLFFASYVLVSYFAQHFYAVIAFAGIPPSIRTSLSVRNFHNNDSDNNRKKNMKRFERKDDGRIYEEPNPMGARDDSASDGKSLSKVHIEIFGVKLEDISEFVQNAKDLFNTEEAQEDFRIYTTGLFTALVLRFFVIEPRYIPSLSMFPTFDVGDQLAVEKVTKRYRPPSRNEIVVFNPPQAFKNIVGTSNRKSKEALIKRIVAVEGDKVEVRRGKLFINGIQQEEQFTAEDAQYEFGPVQVPADEVLVLGDNRNHSLDGHIWGFLPKENIIGRAVFIYWPPTRIGSSGMF